MPAAVNRKGVFLGAYVPPELKESLRKRAAGEHRTMSQEVTRILSNAILGNAEPNPEFNNTPRPDDLQTAEA